MEASRETYDALQERINKLEAERAGYEAGGGTVPSRLLGDLAEFKIQAEEVRKAGHRATVEEIREGDRKAKQQDLRSRLAREWRRIKDAPPVDPSEIRERREALGASQQQLAQFAGVSKVTIQRTETLTTTPEPLTLRLIAAGLEALENWRKEAV